MSRPSGPSPVSDLLARRARLDGGREAIVSGEERLTFSEFDERVDRAAAWLRGLCLRPGDRIAVLARNGTALLELYYAAARAGLILCPLNYRLAVPELAAILRDCGAALLLAEADFTPAAAALTETVGVPLTLIGSGPEDYPALRDRSKPADMEELAPDPPLVLVYTSGTTGRPKGVLLTQSQMVWASATMAASLDYRRADRSLIATPLFHVGGLSFATLFVHLGACAVVLPQWEAATAARVIADEAVAHFFAVPAMLQVWLEWPGFADADFRSLRWILCGGAPLPRSIALTFAAKGVPVAQTYGASETAGPATFLQPDEAVARLPSAGRPFFHTDLRVIGSDGSPCPPGINGHVQVRGPHVFQRYWNDPDATNTAFDGLWLRTGDLGHIDPRGYLHIAGRAKDVIITGGENVHPAELEELLELSPDILEVVVIGIPDERWGEVVCAVVVPHPGRTVTLDGIRAALDGRIARYKLPSQLRLSSIPLPRTATGKLLRQAVKPLQNSAFRQ